MDGHSDVGHRLRRSLIAARRAKEWSQRRLAEEAGVSAHTVQKIESEDVSPSLAMVERLASALQVPVCMLLGDPRHQEAVPGWSALGATERALVGSLVAYLGRPN